MTNRNQTFKKKLEAFEEAVREHAFIGAKDPEDRPAISENYRKTRESLIKYHSKLRNHSLRTENKVNV